MATIPDHLQSTWELLRRAFPNDVPAEEYLPLLALLYPHMADENIAIVMSELTGRDSGSVLNDVYKAGSGSGITEAAKDSVLRKLQRAGFEEWKKEE